MLQSCKQSNLIHKQTKNTHLLRNLFKCQSPSRLNLLSVSVQQSASVVVPVSLFFSADDKWIMSSPFLPMSPVSDTQPSSQLLIHFQLLLIYRCSIRSKGQFILFITSPRAGGECLLVIPFFIPTRRAGFTGLMDLQMPHPPLWAVSGKTHFHASLSEDCGALK